MAEAGGINLYEFLSNEPTDLFDLDGNSIGPPPGKQHSGQPEYQIIPQGLSPTYPTDGVWMCKEELVGKKVNGILHHRFIVFDGDAKGFEKKTWFPFGFAGGVRNEADQRPLRHNVMCYEMKCLKKDCARKIFDAAVSSGQGKRYWLGFRDCQSWANNVERSMYKECEDCPCPKEEQGRKNHFKFTGWSSIQINENQAPQIFQNPQPSPQTILDDSNNWG